MKKAVILSASYGEGHNAAARGLLAGFEHTGGIEASMLDVFATAYGNFYHRTRKDYLQLIDRAPKVWAALYGLLDRTPAVHAMVRLLGGLESALQRVLEEQQPAAIVTTYPVYNYLLNRIAARRVLPPFGLYTVVTDSITVNSVWYRCDTDLFFVPNSETARVMERAGVPAAKLSVSGFPVPPRFALDRPARASIEAERRPRVLYMINAGKSRAPGIVEKLLEISNVDLTVTVGKDEDLRTAVSNVAARANRQIEIHGWTPEMPNLLSTLR